MERSTYQARLRFYDNDENDKVILDWLKTIQRGAQNALIKKKLVQAILMENSGNGQAVVVTEKKQFAKISGMSEPVEIPATEKNKEDIYRHMDVVLEGLDDL